MHLLQGCHLQIGFLIVVFSLSSADLIHGETKGEARERRQQAKLTRERIEFERNAKEAGDLCTLLQKDLRRPDGEDLSGVWVSGKMTGITFQLEQKGETLTGRGYTWGCLGVYDAFAVTGTYRNAKIVLRFTWKSGETEQKVYQYYTPGLDPTFHEGRPDSPMGMTPEYLREKRRAAA